LPKNAAKIVWSKLFIHIMAVRHKSDELNILQLYCYP